jgi:hypothetical protein
LKAYHQLPVIVEFVVSRIRTGEGGEERRGGRRK